MDAEMPSLPSSASRDRRSHHRDDFLDKQPSSSAAHSPRDGDGGQNNNITPNRPRSSRPATTTAVAAEDDRRAIYRTDLLRLDDRRHDGDDDGDGDLHHYHDTRADTDGHGHGRPRSRATTLAFLALVGIAIAHAVASGFEGMHDKRRQHRGQHSRGQHDNIMTQQPPPSPPPPEGFTEDVTVNNMPDNKIAYDNRSVNANNANDPPFEDDDGKGMAEATILSRSSQLASLISDLDASDVVECYVVTRMARLTNAPASVAGSSSSSSSSNNNNNDDDGGRKRVRRMLDESHLAATSSADDTDTPTASADPFPTTGGAAGGGSVPSGPISVRKSALAFRHRPRAASARAVPDGDSEDPDPERRRREYFELTLEYGPRRAGAARASESVPVVRSDWTSDRDRHDRYDYNEGRVGYVSWENEGRVYHSTSISHEWTEAYYMAAVTGVVFEKIIQRAADYAFKRPRYQPFEAVSIPSGNLILRSSGSDDFVWDMFRDLAELYVDIDPILIPPRGKVQFYVADPTDEDEGSGGTTTFSGAFDDSAGRRGEGDAHAAAPNSNRRRHGFNPNARRVKGPLEGSRAAAFYENFFNCANAIRTGDYSIYITPPPSRDPTLSPTAAEGNNGMDSEGGDQGDQANLVEEGIDGSVDDDENGGDDNDVEDDNDEAPNVQVPNVNIAALEPHPGDGIRGDNGRNHTAEETSVDDGSEGNRPNETDSSPQRSGNETAAFPHHRRLNATKEEGRSHASEEAAVEGNEPNDGLEGNEPIKEDGTRDEKDNDNDNDNDNVTSSSEDHASFDYDSNGAEDGEDDAAKAAETAAIEAAKAAENAAAVVATNTSSAADAAAATGQAALAAARAKDASTAARSKSSAEALLSGDGELMTSVLSECFSDPKYGIRTREGGTIPDPDDGGGHGHSGAESASHPRGRESTFAYVYVDGDAFVRLNLTAPYWGTTSASGAVPPRRQGPEGRGDAVDWAIFMLILAGTLFGFLVMAHQVGVVVDERLQFRKVFHPTEQRAGEDRTVEGTNVRGGGFLHSELRMTVESIPTSMGGEDTPTSAYRDRPDAIVDVGEDSDRGLDIEMAKRREQPSDRPNNGLANNRTRPISANEGTEARSRLPGSLRMKRDTPDLVERPSLKSMSKIALPRQSPRADDTDAVRKLSYGNGGPILPLT